MKQIEKVLLSLLILLSAGLQVLANVNVNELKHGTIKGRILDTSNQTLPGATIYID